MKGRYSPLKAPDDAGAPGPGRIALIGTLLALPPIALDLTYGFARDLNVALPEALFFYTAAALTAEVAFHLLPLAVLALLLPPRTPTALIFLPAVFAEPGFQASMPAGGPVPPVTVFLSVSLVGACQLWLFRRHGFAAMIALRLAYDAVWHGAWGVLRLEVLF